MKEASDNTIPFERHPLYQEAMQQIVAGDEEGAMASLKRLIERYPEEQALQDLLMRLQLRSTFGGEDYIPVDHSQGTPILRTVVLALLAITTCLVIGTGLVALYNNWWIEIVRAKEAETQIDALWEKFEGRLADGDLSGCRDILEELETLTPNDTAIQEAIAEIDWRKLCLDIYADAATAWEQRGDRIAAMELLVQHPEDCENHDLALALLEDLRKLDTVETAWVQAQDLLRAEDWQGAADILSWIRQEDLEFKPTQVQDLLFDCHRRIAQDLLDRARGDAGLVSQAANHLQEALRLKPANQEMVDALRMARAYVVGSEAYDSGDWASAAARWNPLYAMQPNYQNGVLEQKLNDSYPRAARQLVSEANGSVRLLTDAVDYFDEALVRDPANEELQQERTFAVEYLAGQEAYVATDYDLAISHWGPLYAERPDYQNNVLHDNLRLACTQSLAPDAQYCTP